MAISQILFSFDGRLTRAPFIAIYIPVVIAAILLRVFVDVLVDLSVRRADFSALWFWWLATIAAVILVVWINFAIIIKRCHDRDKSGSWALLSFVPVVGLLWVIIELGCFPGTRGPNRFGPDPRDASPARHGPASQSSSSHPAPRHMNALTAKDQQLNSQDIGVILAQHGLSLVEPGQTYYWEIRSKDFSILCASDRFAEIYAYCKNLLAEDFRAASNDGTRPDSKVPMPPGHDKAEAAGSTHEHEKLTRPIDVPESAALPTEKPADPNATVTPSAAIPRGIVEVKAAAAREIAGIAGVPPESVKIEVRIII